jgi:hypothetical protein
VFSHQIKLVPGTMCATEVRVVMVEDYHRYAQVLLTQTLLQYQRMFLM